MKIILLNIVIVIILTTPTIAAAEKPTSNGLYPISFNSLMFIDSPNAAIAILRNTRERSLDALVIEIK